MAEIIEKCAGCGKATRVRDGRGHHPWVGIMHQTDAEAIEGVIGEQEPSQRGFVSVPVCNECHSNPANRTYPLKAAFFPKGAEDQAKQLAGSSNIGGNQ